MTPVNCSVVSPALLGFGNKFDAYATFFASLNLDVGFVVKLLRAGLTHVVSYM